MNDRIRIIKYEQAADEKVSLGGIKWQRKWDVCVQCDSLEEAERVRAALAQPEQGPALNCTRVACMGNSGCIGRCWSKATTQPQRNPLTEQEIVRTLRPTVWTHVEGNVREQMIADARAIEAAHGIKD